MDVWFPLNNPIKPCSVLDKICWYTASTNIKITEIIPFSERQMWKTEHFSFRWTLWVFTQIYSKTRVYWNCLSQSITKFLQREPIPTHYLPEMLRLILKENFFRFNGKDYLQNHGESYEKTSQKQTFKKIIQIWKKNNNNWWTEATHNTE